MQTNSTEDRAGKSPPGPLSTSSLGFLARPGSAKLRERELHHRMPSTGPQLFAGEHSRIHSQGSSRRTGPPTVTWDPIWAVQLLTSQARANQKYSPCVHPHSAAAVGFGVFLLLVEQHQGSRGEAEPLATLNTLHLSDLVCT